MLDIDIPGSRPLRLEYLIADFNGTLACDGELLPGVSAALHQLSEQLVIHVVTADTFGQARSVLARLPCELTILSDGAQAAAKQRHVEHLGAARCVCIGNGRNDRLMLNAAGLSIAVVQREGVAVDTLLAADVLVPDIDAALGLLLHPARLVATLRI